MSKRTCRICFEQKAEEDMQELNCRHEFCTSCLSHFTGMLCPKVYCVGTRSTDVIVDEMAGMDEYGSTQISFGTQAHNVIDLEEKLRCEAMKGQHPCVNIARMHLKHCRHRLCFDCLAEKLQKCLSSKDVPHCPLQYCSNRVSPNEIKMMAVRAPNYRYICDAAEKLPLNNILPEMSPLPQEVFIDCYVYGREQTKKSIIIPKMCLIQDVINAVLQLQRLASNRSTSSMDIYFRKESGEKKWQYKYERIITQNLEKSVIRDMNWPDKITFVIDIDGQLAKAAAAAVNDKE
ncbi:unnamed protein product [Caenorhabditis auriculariae]|uniref:RING-type domain-containing protein n=1 Tax=Caenorhabditis auriculariae TaxID=2777116 RepID=A0A8S1HNL5_9PELO|nr:unnamed protein product [Caenorhabditis auriculariae]